MIKKLLIASAMAASLALTTTALAADKFTEIIPAVPDVIAGKMTIDFTTRTELDDTGKVPEGSPAVGVQDIYKTDIVILNSIGIRGEVRRQPWLPTTTLGRTYQDGFIKYDLTMELINPKNPSQRKTLGVWTGANRLDGEGIYKLQDPPEGQGVTRIATDTIGTISGFTSEFAGEIVGRVPPQAGLFGMVDRAKKKINKTYTRYVKGKAVKVSVEGADPMGFKRVEVAQGPLAAYPLTRLNGSVDYDSEAGIWYVDLSASYSAGGQQINDRYSGTIRWTEDTNRVNNGKGAYQVNVRLNEQPVDEAAVFEADATTTEEDFFSEDIQVPGFIGSVSYLDKFEGESVIRSDVTYDIDGVQISKIQAMNFAKILLLVVGPFNDE